MERDGILWVIMILLAASFVAVLIPIYFLTKTFHWAVRSVTQNWLAVVFLPNLLAACVWLGIFRMLGQPPFNFLFWSQNVRFVNFLLWSQAVCLVASPFYRKRPGLTREYALLRAGASAMYFGGYLVVLGAFRHSSTGLGAVGFTLACIGIFLWATADKRASFDDGPAAK